MSFSMFPQLELKCLNDNSFSENKNLIFKFHLGIDYMNIISLMYTNQTGVYKLYALDENGTVKLK